MVVCGRRDEPCCRYPDSFGVPVSVAEGPQSTAILVFRGSGELLFANPYAHAILGLSEQEKVDLQGWCIRCFPVARDYDRVARSLRRALSGEGLSAGGSFWAQFLNHEGRLMEGLFHVVSWMERNGETRAMLTCVPSFGLDRAPLVPKPQPPPLESMTDLMERIRELLDVALTVGRVSFDDAELGPDPQEFMERLEFAKGVLKNLNRQAS